MTPDPEVNLGLKPQKYTPSLGSKKAPFLPQNSSYIRNFPKKAPLEKKGLPLRTFWSSKTPPPKNDRRLAFTFLALFGFSPKSPQKPQKKGPKKVLASRPWPTGKGQKRALKMALFGQKKAKMAPKKKSLCFATKSGFLKKR